MLRRRGAAVPPRAARPGRFVAVFAAFTMLAPAVKMGRLPTAMRICDQMVNCG
jgi:hypothetical protein